MRALALVLVAAGLLAPARPWAHDDDHDRARAAAEAGLVLPLQTVLARLSASHPGQVLEVELEHEDDGRWLYEIKLLQPGGVLRKLKVDARSGEVLAARERRGRR